MHKYYPLEYTLVILVIFSGTALGLSQTIYYYFHAPPGTVYPFVHNFVEDYFYYLHIMRQGWDGFFLATSRMTPEVYPGRFVVVFFLAIGHIARIFHLSLPFAYTLVRAVGSVALLSLVYAFSRFLYPVSFAKRITALVFAVVGTYYWGVSNSVPSVAALVHSWTELDPLSRLTFIPHHLWSKVLMLASFVIVLILIHDSARINQRGKTILFIALTLSVSGMGFSSPVALSTFIPVVFLWVICELARKSIDKKRLWVILPAFISALVVSLVVVMYHRYVQQSVFPWTSYLMWEKNQYAITPLGYAASFGPLLAFFCFALFRLIRKGPVGTLLITWFVSGWVLLFLVGPYLPLSNIRYLGGYQFIPVALAAPLGIETVVRKITKKYSGKLFVMIVFVLLFYSSVGLWASYRELIGYAQQNASNPSVYVPVELTEVFNFLDKYGQSGDVVIAPYWVSTMIPAFTSLRVVAGHEVMSENAEVKRAELEQFYIEEPAFREAIIRKYRGRFVLEEKNESGNLGNNSLPESIVFENERFAVQRIGN